VKPKKKRAPQKEDAEATLPPADTEATDAAPAKGGVLVIVESRPRRKRSASISRGYNGQATVGHLRDLPRRELGVDVENNFTPKYVTIKEKAKTLAEIKKAAKGADRVALPQHREACSRQPVEDSRACWRVHIALVDIHGWTMLGDASF